MMRAWSSLLSLGRDRNAVSGRAAGAELIRENGGGCTASEGDNERASVDERYVPFTDRDG